MIWTKKGKEFERYDFFSEIQRIYIYGAGSRGKSICEQIIIYCRNKIEIVFIDQKVNSDDGKYKIIRPNNFIKQERDQKSIVVIAIEDGVENLKVVNLLMGCGYSENINFFQYYSFASVYVKLLALLACHRCCLDTLSIPLNFRCTLRCKNCSGRFPELTKKRIEDRKLKAVLEDAQVLFESVDYISKFDGGGGEVFLYPYLAEFLDEVGKSFGDKIGEHLIVTNGTVIPSDKLCRSIKENGVKLYVSYYDNVNGWKDQYAKVIKKLDYFGIKPLEIHHQYWINFHFKMNSDKYHEEDFDYRYNMCGMRCGMFFNGRQYICYPGASNSMLLDVFDEKDGLEYKTANKEIIYEFNHGFHEKCGVGGGGTTILLCILWRVLFRFRKSCTS